MPEDGCSRFLDKAQNYTRNKHVVIIQNTTVVCFLKWFKQWWLNINYYIHSANRMHICYTLIVVDGATIAQSVY